MEYKFNSQIRPSGFPHDFDAHIYFDEPTLPIARNLKAQVELIFSQQIQEGSLFVGHLITRSVGPHPLPMFEINFSKSLFGTFVPWLMQNRKNLDALVHSISKDDLYDHTQGAVWLGRQLPLDFSKF